MKKPISPNRAYLDIPLSIVYYINDLETYTEAVEKERNVLKASLELLHGPLSVASLTARAAFAGKEEG